MPPISCHEAEVWIAVKADGMPLPEEVSTLLGAHLSRCSACARLLHGEERRSACLRKVLASAAVAGATAAIVHAAMTSRRRPSRGVPVWVPALAATAGLAVASWLLLSYFPGHGTDEPPAPAPPDVAIGVPGLSPPVNVRYEEVLVNDEEVPQAQEGAPLRRQTERKRVIDIPVGVPAEGRPPARPGMGWQQVRSRYIRPVSLQYE